MFTTGMLGPCSGHSDSLSISSLPSRSRFQPFALQSTNSTGKTALRSPLVYPSIPSVYQIPGGTERMKTIVFLASSNDCLTSVLAYRVMATLKMA